MNLSIEVYDREENLLNRQTDDRPAIKKEEILNIIDNAIDRNNLLYMKRSDSENGASYK